MVVRYKKREELLNEEKAKERSTNEVRIFTQKSNRVGQHQMGTL
ncbi:hypothetical protein AGMMS49525_17230 [Bacteroidia bacterium]|nr:hypothetical protein AGMMS49525_17230 [Bacteroidia bacterium]